MLHKVCVSIEPSANIMRIDVEALREYLIDYYSTAAFMASPLALAEVCSIEKMSAEELVNKALKEGIDLTRFSC